MPPQSLTTEEHVHFHIPWLAQCVNEIWPLGRKLIVDPPSRGQLARTTLDGRLKREQTHDVARIRVEDLLVSCVCRRTDLAGHFLQVAEVLDVRQDHVRGTAVERAPVVLTTTLRGDVCRQAGVDDNVLLARVLVDAHAADDEEAVSEVQLMGQPAELCVQLREGERLLGDVWKRQIEC